VRDFSIACIKASIFSQNQQFVYENLEKKQQNIAKKVEMYVNNRMGCTFS
jgi:hypothetical protein